MGEQVQAVSVKSGHARGLREKALEKKDRVKRGNGASGQGRGTGGGRRETRTAIVARANREFISRRVET